MKLKDAYSLEGKYDQPRQHIKKQRHYFANKGSSSQGYGFSSSHVWMSELDHEEGWAPKNWCFWTVVLEKTLEALLQICKEIKPVHPKGNHSWIFTGRTDEAPILQPPDAEPTHWKRPWCWERLKAGEGTTEDEMTGWYHQLEGPEFEQAPGDGEGQGSLTRCSPWGCKVGHNWVTEQQARFVKSHRVYIYVHFSEYTYQKFLILNNSPNMFYVYTFKNCPV